MPPKKLLAQTQTTPRHPHTPAKVSMVGPSTLTADQSLADLLGSLIDTGVVLQADAVLTLADVDLVYVGLKAVICATDAAPARAALGHGYKP